jgi:uncharacterized membrane protein YfcA
VVLGGYHLGKVSPGLFVWIVGLFLLAFALEYFFHRLSRRSVQARTEDNAARQAMGRVRSTDGQV